MGAGALLEQGALFNQSLQALPTGDTTFIPKGVYFFKTLDDADAHRDECLAKGMAQRARARR